MNVLDKKFKEFAFSSISENEEYKKIYIISLHSNDDNIIENIPYVHIIFDSKKIKINESNYEIPKLVKHLCFLDKKNDKLIVDDKTLNYIDEYIRNLSKIERLFLLIRSDLNNMDFYMLKEVSELIDNINLIIFEFESSINFFSTTENVNKIENLKNLSSNIKSMITSKVIYLDILNSRILSIVSLSALPILVLMTIWSTTVKKEDSILYKNDYKFAYRITYLISILLVLGIIYRYRKDFH
tara:strand:- start:1848 stop:2570 length:723 start_codon:yes stop_codon:yes gene_type:complete